MNLKHYALAFAIAITTTLHAQNHGVLNINDVHTRIYSNGLIGMDLGNQTPDYIVPAGQSASPLFSAGLWIGGLDTSNQVHIAAQEYETLATGDFWPGPLTNTGGASITPAVSQLYDQVWSVLHSQSAEQDAYYRCLTTPGCDVNVEFPDYTIPPSFFSWPAIGDVGAGQDLYQAPFHDFNGDGDYNPSDGDYPCLLGDQSLWLVFNDKLNTHAHTGGQQIGIEVQMNPFAYSSGNAALNQTVFVFYRIINQGTLTLHNAYVGLFADFDLGCGQDDYVQCDAARSLFYVVNGDNNDEDCAGELGYGTQPPAFGAAILRGPYLDYDGIDNTTTLAIPALNGTHFNDGVADNERYGLSYFHYLLTSGGAQGEPGTPAEFMNALQGVWKDGTPQSYGSTGYSTDPNAMPAHFMFPGNSDPTGVGTNGQIEPAWTEGGAGNMPGDRKALGSMGPFTMEPGQYNDVLVAFVYARASSGGPNASADALRSRVDSVRAFANTFPDGFRGDPLPCGLIATGVAEYTNDVAPLQLYPVPVTDQLQVRVPGLVTRGDLMIHDATGKLVLSHAIAGERSTIDVAALASGVYEVSITSAARQWRGRFVKQ